MSTTAILNKVNEVSRNEKFSTVTNARKNNGAKMLVLASSDFNIWISFSSGKFYADDNKGKWYGFKS